jgi:hypothetical protein
VLAEVHCGSFSKYCCCAPALALETAKIAALWHWNEVVSYYWLQKFLWANIRRPWDPIDVFAPEVALTRPSDPRDDCCDQCCKCDCFENTVAIAKHYMRSRLCVFALWGGCAEWDDVCHLATCFGPWPCCGESPYDRVVRWEVDYVGAKAQRTRAFTERYRCESATRYSFCRSSSGRVAASIVEEVPPSDAPCWDATAACEACHGGAWPEWVSRGVLGALGGAGVGLGLAAGCAVAATVSGACGGGVGGMAAVGWPLGGVAVGAVAGTLASSCGACDRCLARSATTAVTLELAPFGAAASSAAERDTEVAYAAATPTTTVLVQPTAAQHTSPLNGRVHSYGAVSSSRDK